MLTAGSLAVKPSLVEIAKALSIDARILIMDDTTSALSPGECQRLFAIVRHLAARGAAIVYISHRIDAVMHLAGRVTVLHNGRHVSGRQFRLKPRQHLAHRIRDPGRSRLNHAAEAG